MNCKYICAPLCITAAALVAVVGTMTIASAQPGMDKAPAHAPTPSAPATGQPEMKLPAGWTPADMQACMDAGTPGKMHEWLAKGAGVWHGKQTMWMAPGAEALKSDCTSTITPMMDGRYFKCEMAGEIPGMGPFNGFGLSGFDNVSQKFVGSWIDNHSTGIMTGTGELSSDQKTLTWTYAYNCPITKKPTVMREVDTFTGKDTMTMEMFGIEPKSGKEFKMIHIDFKKK